jgi:pimeloyl-ACP methyl ester carboxylesterase
MMRIALAAALCAIGLAPGLRAAEKDLTLQTASGALVGTESFPEAAGRVPVVLIVAGSGPTNRDGNTPLIPGRNDSLKMIAEGLGRAGIASVRYDKRGIGASAAAMKAEADIRFEHLVDDAAAWVEKLRADPRFSKVLVAGHSEGSLVGMLAARKARADGFASIAGLARSGDAVIRDQLAGKLPPNLAAESDRILEALKSGSTVADPPKELLMLYRPSIQPYFISWFRYTPSQVIASLEGPVLIAQGSHDLQVGVSEAKALAAARPAARLVVVEGMNHVLKIAPADAAAQRASYGDPSLPVAPALLEALVEWAR